MRIQQIRNATLKIEYGDVTFLIDPWLQDKGCGFSASTIIPEMAGIHNPMNDLPMPPEEILQGIDYAANAGICTASQVLIIIYNAAASSSVSSTHKKTYPFIVLFLFSLPGSAPGQILLPPGIPRYLHNMPCVFLPG